jgi:glutaminase
MSSIISSVGQKRRADEVPLSPKDYARKHISMNQEVCCSNSILHSIRAYDLGVTGSHGSLPERLLHAIESSGLQLDDVRLVSQIDILVSMQSREVSCEQVAEAVGESDILVKVLTGKLTVPSWEQFCADVVDIYESLQRNSNGTVPDYITSIHSVCPDKFAVSICTLDGQQFSLGDFTEPVAVQAAGYPISYLMALEELGTETVHKHVGFEPSGLKFNELTLKEVPVETRNEPTRSHIPHNPLVNAGAIMCSSLIKVYFFYFLGFWYIVATSLE